MADYQAAGGLQGAAQQSAELAYAELDEERRQLARRMFLRLVAVDEDVVTTRRRIDRAELPIDDMAAVLEGFIAARLITVDELHVEISQDALLTVWPRLAEWVAADQAGLLTHRRLTRAAKDWRDNGFDDHLLMRGSPLAAAEDWAGDPDHRAAMNDLERSFLAASAAARVEEQRAARHRVTVLHRLAGTLSAALLITVLLAVVAWQSGVNASRARDEALSRQVAIEAMRASATDPALAQQLALAAFRISTTVDARSALLDTSTSGVVARRVGASGPTAMRLSPNGTVLAVSNGTTGTVALYRYITDRIGSRPGLLADAGSRRASSWRSTPWRGVM